jgi:hypothetical protein
MMIGGGVLSILMAIFHFKFPQILDWKSEFAKIGPAKGKIHYTINLALILIFTGIGLLSIVYAHELAHPAGVGFGLIVLFSLFWLWRTIWQVVYFRLPKGAKPKSFVVMHYILIVYFALLTIFYAIPIVAMEFH